MRIHLPAIAIGLLCLSSCTQPTAAPVPAPAAKAYATYLANEGVMIVDGERKILFDPLFRDHYGYYRLVPAELKTALLEGKPPFDGVDAVFISHSHGDHFSPDDVLTLLQNNPDTLLYAPTQAVAQLRQVASAEVAGIFERVTAISLAYKDAPQTLSDDGIVIEAVRIPHAGWPEGRTEVENIVFRVTLNEATTVVHMGDADARDLHFARDADYWHQRELHVAFPPYWFFSTPGGKEILSDRLRAQHSIGVHVPTDMPEDASARPAELLGVDLFTKPGETRIIGDKAGEQ